MCHAGCEWGTKLYITGNDIVWYLQFRLGIEWRVIDVCDKKMPLL